MAAISRELERVTALRSESRRLANIPGVNMVFASRTDTAAINKAQGALQSGAPAKMIAALKELEECK